MNRLLTTSALILLAGCCERCHEPDQFERVIAVNMTLGEIGTDCSGSDTVQTEQGTFTATWTPLTISGTPMCTATVAWTDGMLVDMADIWSDVEQSPPPGVDLSTVEVLIHQLTFDVQVAELVDADGNDIVAAEDVELAVVLVDPAVDVTSDAAFDDARAFAVIDKRLGDGLDIGTLVYGPDEVKDYEEGQWPYLDRANQAFRDLGPLEVSGRAALAFPMSVLDTAGAPRLSFTAQMTIYADVSACAPFPPAGGGE